MSDPLSVVWSDGALKAWRRLPFDDAESVAAAVHRFAHGDPAGIVIAQGPYEFALFVGARAVILVHDPAAGVLHVDEIRQA